MRAALVREASNLVADGNRLHPTSPQHALLDKGKSIIERCEAARNDLLIQELWLLIVNGCGRHTKMNSPTSELGKFDGENIPPPYEPPRERPLTASLTDSRAATSRHSSATRLGCSRAIRSRCR